MSIGSISAALSIAKSNKSPRMNANVFNPTKSANALNTSIIKSSEYKSEFKNSLFATKSLITDDNSLILISSPITVNTAFNNVSITLATVLISSLHISLVKYSKSSTVYLGSKPKSKVSNAKLTTVAAHCSGAHKKIFKLPKETRIFLNASPSNLVIVSDLYISTAPNLTMSLTICPNAFMSFLRPNPVNFSLEIASSINDKSRPSISTLPITYETTFGRTGTNKSISDTSIMMSPMPLTLVLLIATLISALTSST